jgi:MoaA/NifB/PqqE/SkfB family radical SAM enzyme
MGIAFFNIEGGEPFLTYDRLRRVCEAIDDRSEIWINSTGDRMSMERLSELKKSNVTAIMFSLHSPDPDEFNRFMGVGDAWQTMRKGIELCHQAGIAVALNTCLQKNDFYNGMFEAIMERAKEFETSIVQIIKPKAAGGWLDSDIDEFTGEDIHRVKKLVNKYNLESKYKDYPAISAQVREEDKNVFGCTAGGTDRFYINAKGDLQPCEFLNISFGNIASDNFETIYRNMRNHFEKPGECWLCEKYSGEILRLFKENSLKSLPLSPDLSRTIYDKWNRGKETRLYKKLTDMQMHNFVKKNRI